MLPIIISTSFTVWLNYIIGRLVGLLTFVLRFVIIVVIVVTEHSPPPK